MPLDVTSIQHGCVYDGDGVRTTVFLRGCPFCCPWCCNPETLRPHGTMFIDESKCLVNKGIESPLCKDCERTMGQRGIMQCPLEVAELTSKEYSINALYEELIADISLYKQSNGGITFSGGDPLLHSEQLIPLLNKLKSTDIHIAFETTLYFHNKEVLCDVSKYVDQWIVDLKLQPVNYKEDFETIITNNLSFLQHQGKNLLFRLVYVEGMDASKILEVLQRLDITILEVIKCHALAKTKYQKLGLTFEDYTPREELFHDFVNKLSHKIDIKELTI